MDVIFFLRGVLYVFCSYMQVSFTPGTLLISCNSFGSYNLQARDWNECLRQLHSKLSPQKL